MLPLHGRCSAEFHITQCIIVYHTDGTGSGIAFEALGIASRLAANASLIVLFICALRFWGHQILTQKLYPISPKYP